MTNPTELEILDRADGVLYAACAGVWVMILFAEPTAPDMLRARGALRTMAAQQPGGFPTLTWVLPEAGMRMGEDARNAATEVTREYDRSIVAQATLIEGSGFQAAAARAIIATLDLVSRSSGPKKVFATLPPAVAWCLRRRPAAEPVPEPEVVAALEGARRLVVPRG